MTESEIQERKLPNWLRLWLAVVAAIVFFRVGRLVMVVFFFFVELLPMKSSNLVVLSVCNFLDRWDFAFVLMVAITSAVVASRWIERKMLSRSFRAGLVTCLVFTAIAAFPYTLRTEAHGAVFISPLQIAIRDNYSTATIEAIINHNPRLVHGEQKPFYRFVPLEDAAMQGRTDLVELLIRKGANVDTAIRELEEFKEESAVKLVLDCSNRIQKAAPTNSAPSTQTP